MRTSRNGTRVFLVGLVAMSSMLSCSIGETGISGYEEEAIAEQAAYAVSVEEGGAVYSAELLADPSFYEELEASNPLPDGDTGYRTVSLTIDFPYYEATTTAVIRYRLLDAGGAVQAEFGPDTRVAEASLSYTRDVAALRYTATMELTTTAVVAGLQTGAVTLNGEFNYFRTAESADGLLLDFFLELSAEAELTDVSIVYDPDLGKYSLAGGTSSSELSGSINGRSYARSASWIFMEGYQASMTYEGEMLTVNIETGIIL